MTEKAGEQLRKLRKLVDKPCIDCEVMMLEVYPNKKRCKKCSWKHNSKNSYQRKKAVKTAPPQPH